MSRTGGASGLYKIAGARLPDGVYHQIEPVGYPDRSGRTAAVRSLLRRRSHIWLDGFDLSPRSLSLRVDFLSSCRSSSVFDATVRGLSGFDGGVNG